MPNSVVAASSGPKDSSLASNAAGILAPQRAVNRLSWAVPMMGLVFGLGHIGLGVFLLIQERRESGLRLHRSVA